MVTRHNSSSSSSSSSSRRSSVGRETDYVCIQRRCPSVPASAQRNAAPSAHAAAARCDTRLLQPGGRCTSQNSSPHADFCFSTCEDGERATTRWLKVDGREKQSHPKSARRVIVTVAHQERNKDMEVSHRWTANHSATLCCRPKKVL